MKKIIHAIMMYIEDHRIWKAKMSEHLKIRILYTK